MTLQVLLSVMGQKDHSIIKKVGIQTDAIIINQDQEFKSETIRYKDNKIQFLTFNERGIGLSRNNALMRADADIVVFGDQDIEYVDQYESIIVSEFENNPKADMIVFNVPSKNPERLTYMIKRKSRVRLYNCSRYGAVKMAIRTDKVRQNNIYFSLMFGGGAKYSSGEDSLFIHDVIKSGLRVYACTNIIGYVAQDSSTWFSGYTDTYFKDKGVLFGYLSPRLSYLRGLAYVIRKYRTFKIDDSIQNTIRQVFSGIKESKGRS